MDKRLQECAVQNRKNCTETAQTKLGKTHVDYWSARLEKRTFTGRDGLIVEIPAWQVRIQHLCRSAYFNLKTANAAEAAVKAREIYVFLAANGWDATLEKFKPQPVKRTNLSIDEFAELYRTEVEFLEYPPGPRSIERNIASLRMISRIANVRRLAALTPEKVTRFKRKYLKQGEEQGREESSVKTSCNAHLRAAAALYSKQMMNVYERLHVEVTNPFAGQNLRRIELKPYTPMPPELLDSIWRDSAKLRDGDPQAAAPPPRNKGGRPKKDTPIERAPKKEIRWKEPDWREPHPEAYQLLLLELGLGLRREESDKAQWDWFFVLNGRRYIEVKKTDYFTPKGKRRRVIPVEEILWEALQQGRQEGSPFVVPGKPPKIYTRKTTPTNIPYRCERHHRTLIAWLRKKGITDSKPCHLLRKEFGSYVATSFGLFAAQRLLGHSSPTVTEAFYAGLTNLPELNHVKISASKPLQPVVVQGHERTVAAFSKLEPAPLTLVPTSSFKQPASPDEYTANSS